MKKIFEGKLRTVPKCKECKSYNDVVLATYGKGTAFKEKYWECNKCCCVIRKARN